MLREYDKDLIKALEGVLHGGVESKVNLIGDFIYQNCKDRFGEVISKKRTALREKGRRVREICQLVQRHGQLCKNWRKVTQAKNKGLKALWEGGQARASQA